MNSVAFASAAAGKIVIREEISRDFLAREALLDRAFGLSRWRKTSERLREGRRPAQGLALSALGDGVLVVTALLGDRSRGGPRRAAARPDRGQRRAARARPRRRDDPPGAGARPRLRPKAALLVGDAPYYERFGFSRALTENLDMPGPVDRARFLALELEQGALAGAQGVLRPTGALAAPARERGWLRAA